LFKYSGIENFIFDDASLARNILINDFAAIDIHSFESIDEATSLIDVLTGQKGANFIFQISRNIDIVKISYSVILLFILIFRYLKNTLSGVYTMRRFW
jgi:hypothetical protein